MDRSRPRWERFAPGAVLDERAVHVFAFSLAGAAGERAARWRCLAPDERARAARLRFPEQRERFVAARAALRGILGCYLGQRREDVRLVADEGGKPAVAGDPLRFNLSHSHDQGLVALARAREVGVDVEHVRAEVAVAELAAQLFTSREREALLALAPPDRRQAFFTCWARKEALLKATGEGLQRAPGSFDVAWCPDETTGTRWAVIDGVRFAVYDLPPLPGFAAAVAARGGVRQMRCFALEPATDAREGWSLMEP